MASAISGSYVPYSSQSGPSGGHSSGGYYPSSHSAENMGGRSTPNGSAVHVNETAYRPSQQQRRHYPSSSSHQHQSVMEDASDGSLDDDGEGGREDDAEPLDSSEEDFSAEEDAQMDDGYAQAQMDAAQQRFYAEQQQQARYYQQHQMVNGGVVLGTGPKVVSKEKERGERERERRRNGENAEDQGMFDDDDEDEDDDDDDASSTMSIPDANINFNLTYALHTFLATVEGQASVVKGDSLQLLDDANSYWWLVRVLKTEDVGYIPAENIETPYERLARLNKHRNVDLALATHQEKTDGEVQGRERLKAGLVSKARAARADRSGSGGRDKEEGRRVIFAPPTYVEPSIRTWSSDEEGESGDEGEEADGSHQGQAQGQGQQDAQRGQGQGGQVGVREMMEMEPDDGVEWADGAAQEAQRKAVEQRTGQAQAQAQQKPGTTYAQQRAEPRSQVNNGQAMSSPVRDPAEANGDTRRITVTPAVAQSSISANTTASGVLLPSANVSAGQQRNVSGQSTNSIASASSNYSTGSVGGKNGEPSSPQDTKKGNKIRKSTSQDDLNGGASVERSGSGSGEKKEKKRGMLGGLFSRKNKDKKGISSSDPRTSEDSIVSGAIEGSPSSLGRPSEEGFGTVVTIRAPTPAEREREKEKERERRLDESAQGENVAGPTSHSLRLQQKDQATMAAYSTKYLKSSPTGDVRSPTASEAAAAVAQSAAAMRLAASMHGATNRPSSIIVSPNPAAPLLNVMRVFAGEHIRSEASFKTVLLNESTGAADLIRQAVQRFRLPHASQPGIDKSFYLTVKDMNGEELELQLDEKPLQVFLDAVQRCSDEDVSSQGKFARAITPTVKRSSVSSISSVVSLSNHPAIAKLGMNDFSDDSSVKIYLNRRRPGSRIYASGDSTSAEFGSYASGLSTVQEGEVDGLERKSGVWAQGSPNGPSRQGPDGAPMRYNPSLTINTAGHGSHSSPERFTSPSARFTIRLSISPADLPDGSVFDPLNDAIISKQVLRDRLAAGHPNQPSREISPVKRQRFFMLPRNATVLEAIEQGLERLGISDGVVDGGDEVEERGKRVGGRTRYALAVVGSNGKERTLAPASKVLDAYSTLPTFKPVERTTLEQRRRSREWSYNIGSASDILATDPVFELRRSSNRPHPTSHPSRQSSLDTIRASSTSHSHSQSHSHTHTPPASNASHPSHPSSASHSSHASLDSDTRASMSPAEIIAAQRAASRATQKALISAQANAAQGVDVVVPNKGTIRSSRLLQPDGAGEVVRYSYIDGDGETYDISDILEEEWGSEGAASPPASAEERMETLRPPGPARKETDQSVYVTAPSTPEPTSLRPDFGYPAQPGRSTTASAGGSRGSKRISASHDILKGVVERSAAKGEGRLEEKLARVIEKARTARLSASSDIIPPPVVVQSSSPEPRVAASAQPAVARATTPSSAAALQQAITTNSTTTTTTTARSLTPLSDSQAHVQSSPSAGSAASGSPSLSTSSRSGSRQNNYHTTTSASVNRIISRHKQQPSIASIMSDMSGASPHDDDHREARRDRALPASTAGGAARDRDRSGTPNTASSSSHPTPPLGTAIFTRSVSAASTLPRTPIKYTDDFGMKTLMGLVEARAREMRPRQVKVKSSYKGGSARAKLEGGYDAEGEDDDEGDEGEEAIRLLWGERLEREEIAELHPEIRSCLGPIQSRLDAWDQEVDELISSLAKVRAARPISTASTIKGG